MGVSKSVHYTLLCILSGFPTKAKFSHLPLEAQHMMALGDCSESLCPYFKRHIVYFRPIFAQSDTQSVQKMTRHDWPLQQAKHLAVQLWYDKPYGIAVLVQHK